MTRRETARVSKGRVFECGRTANCARGLFGRERRHLFIARSLLVAHVTCRENDRESSWGLVPPSLLQLLQRHPPSPQSGGPRVRFRSGDARPPPIRPPQHPSLLPADRDGTAEAATDAIEGAAHTDKLQRHRAADPAATATATRFQDAIDTRSDTADATEGTANSSVDGSGTMQYCVAEAEATFLATLFNLSPSDLAEAGAPAPAAPEATQPLSARGASYVPAAGARARGDTLNSDRGAGARALLQKALSSMQSLQDRLRGHERTDGEALSLAKGIQTQLEDLAREHGLGDRRQGAEGRECVMCLRDEAEVIGWAVLRPCGHACVCRACCQGLTACPSCRQRVSEWWPIFL